MKARFATEHEIQRWNEIILSNPDDGNVFSSFEFAMQKETGGYKARFIILDNLAITVLEKNTYLLGKFWYIPKGPGVVSASMLFDVLKNLELIAIQNKVFSIRIETELSRDQQPTLQRHGLIKSRPIIPNPSTITLDISKSDEEILKSLPQKGRYAIKRAERENVKIELVKSTDENCKIMYDLLCQTADGQFGIRGFEYYKSFWQRFENAGYGQLFFARYEKQIISGAYAMVFGKKSTYKDGASIRKRNVYGASHLLQWHVIKWSKKHGSILHDFCGSPPSDEISNTEHKHYGIGLFKTAFNKTVTDYIGCYDLVIDPSKYKLWVKLGEKIAHRVHYYKHRDSYY